MNAFDILGDPVRRRILELLTEGELPSGGVVQAIQKELEITQAGVSQHLRVLRESGFAVSRTDGTRRIYTLKPERFTEVDSWLEQFRGVWQHKRDSG